MIINLVLDPTTAKAFPMGLNSLPQAWLAPIIQAKTILEQTFTNNITVTIRLGYGEETSPDGSMITMLPSMAGGFTGPASGPLVPYSTLVAALKAHDPTQTAYNTLPTTAPVGLVKSRSLRHRL